VFVTNTYECKKCGYRWHNPFDNKPDVCPRCRLVNEILFQARKVQIPFTGYITLKPGRGVELSTPNGWIEVLIEDNEQLFIKNQYKTLIRPIQRLEIAKELWEEMKAIQEHVKEEAKRQGQPIIEMTVLPEGATPEDLKYLEDPNLEDPSKDIRPQTFLNRAERRRQKRR
jgi:predicted Zn-ribbon and HTH transcriptional regulator